MKKVRLDIKLNVPDDFECGDCKKCPLRNEEYEEYYPGTGHTTISCTIGFNEGTCPIEVQ